MTDQTHDGRFQPKQKTVIRQLIEKLHERISFRVPIQELSYDIVNEAEIELLKVILKDAQSLEPVNEQQIKDSYIAGMEFIAVDPNYYKQDSEQYFNETFDKI